MMVHRIFVIFCVLILATSSVIAVPMYIQHKRQSDQRVAELETLLALHKYGVGPRRVGGRNSAAGYGLIDFNYIGRRKKSADNGVSSSRMSMDDLHPPNNGQIMEHFMTPVRASSLLLLRGHQNSGDVPPLLPPPGPIFIESRPRQTPLPLHYNGKGGFITE